MVHATRLVRLCPLGKLQPFWISRCTETSGLGLQKVYLSAWYTPTQDRQVTDMGMPKEKRVLGMASSMAQITVGRGQLPL